MDTITNNLRLDLSSLDKTTIFFYDGSTYNYTYSICSNSLYCKHYYDDPQIVSLKQGKPNSEEQDDCWWLLKWDNGKVQPSYNPTTETWTFKYDDGMPCPSPEDPPRQTTVNWHCNPDTSHQVYFLIHLY